MQPDRELKIHAAPARAADPFADDMGQAVLRADVSESAKLAWRYLRLRSRNVRGPLRVSPGEVAASYGRSESSGRRSLNALREAKLIVVLHKLADGTWIIQFNEPDDVSDERLTSGDPELFDLADASPPLPPAEAVQKTQWGEGGEFLGASRETRNQPPPPPNLSSAGTAVASAGGSGATNQQPAAAQVARPVAAAGQSIDWPQVHRRLRSAGLKATASAVAQARDRGLSPAELLGIADEYSRNPARYNGPGAIFFAIRQWQPGDEAENPALWPTPKPGHDPESERRRAAKAAADAEEARAAAETDALNAAASAEGEQRFGPLIDAADEATRASAIELVDPDWRKFVAERWKPGRRPAGVVRDILLRDLSKRPPT